jgi:hypothetical protein
LAGFSHHPPTTTGLGKDAATFMDDLAKCLDCLEEVLRTLTGKVCDQQQQGLSVAILRHEKSVSDAGDNNLEDSTPEITPPCVATSGTGDSRSVASRPTNVHPVIPLHRHHTMETEPDNSDFLPTYHKLDFAKHEDRRSSALAQLLQKLLPRLPDS